METVKNNGFQQVVGLATNYDDEKSSGIYITVIHNDTNSIIFRMKTSPST